MNYGFAIDTRSCIGCHACSTACKSENQVPLGVHRTWVKYTEVGVYPDVRRNFQVTRCNHCANPPCVRVCPVTAMYQRDDGIVEFDSDVCIGCKACLQACPYDAIHIDPDTGTAAKCHFCGHRVENGIEPACVVVCPTHAIIAGDMDDPVSEISRVLASNDVTVRKPEQGTAPKLFYIGGHDAALHPTATERAPAGAMWNEVLDAHGQRRSPGYADAAVYEVGLNVPGLHDTVGHEDTQGSPALGPIQVSPARMAGQMVQVATNAQHKVPWHWQVPAYLVTKGVGAGLFGLLAVATLAMPDLLSPGLMASGGFVGLLGLVATTALLVADLERPERFLSILLRPQWRSWLTRGAFVLIALSGLGTAWWGAEFCGWMGWLSVETMEWVRPLMAVLTLPAAIMGAIYTAFLFAQCEGRDLWQSPLLPAHLLVQAVVAGGASLALLGLGLDLDQGVICGLLVGALIVDAFLMLAGEFGIPHASEVAARAAHDITHGRYARLFWGGAVLLGHVVPVVLLLVGGPVLAALAGALSLVGLYCYEHAFVMAPQEIPNS